MNRPIVARILAWMGITVVNSRRVAGDDRPLPKRADWTPVRVDLAWASAKREALR